jgi:D-alanyl-D-alanine carboxypeptidase
MLPRGAEARRGLRWGIFSLVTVASVLAVSSDPSDARSHRKPVRTQASESAGEEPRYSDIVVDGNSGAVLHAVEADARRHPASLTKIMTLYLLFEQLEAGKLKLDTQLEVSDHAAGQSPTKLGLRSGQTIKVEDAIKGIVTRSANDAAVVVAEQIGGDEESFAKLMTRKAQALGMSHTVYRNASGLPNDDQVTTARDQATLGRAVQERFPHYYKYFSTRSFEFHGESIGNHNHLLGTVDGVDGIKTGYISSSGFNLVTSVHRANRYLVAVVFGGSSAESRDERMRELIKDHITEAATQRTAAVLADAAPKPDLRAEPKPESKPEFKPAREAKPEAGAKPETKPAAVYTTASVASVPITLTSKSDPKATQTVQVPRWTAPAPAPAAPAAGAAPAIGSADPIHPVVVKTISLKLGAGVQTAALGPSPAAPAHPAEPKEAVAAAAEPPAPDPAPASAAPPLASDSKTVATPPASPITTAAVAPAAAMPAAPVAPAAAPGPAASQQSPQHSGWMIQVGAFQGLEEAKQRLSSVQSRAARYLAGADAFTEPVSKGEAIWYRARFAGLDKEQAEAACNYLKRNDVACMTIRN